MPFNPNDVVIQGTLGDFLKQQTARKASGPLPAPELIKLSTADRAVAEKIIAGEVGGRIGAFALLSKIVTAINAQREGDKVGTLRRDGATYAFSYEPGKWLLIDTNKDKLLYRTVTRETKPEVSTWELLYKEAA
ncbi:Uncharacterised protein [Mycobacteroides abscessus subsp. abscessus]|nr:Uncharacterised protein [Mycobacteroides abscessus subsp. abscessus]